MTTAKTAFLLLSFAFTITACAQQKVYSDEIEAQIKMVENSLAGPIQVQGQPEPMNLKDRMDFFKVKGLSIAVVSNYKIVWARGYGWANQASGGPVTTQTLFQAGSISKSLNAVGILKLARQKKLDLYVDINNYLRSWKFPYDSISKGKKISIANLLSHTAGLSVHGFPGYENGDTIPSVPEILDGKSPANTKAVRSIWEPGLKYKYSGGGTTITQQILTDITGKAYHDYMWNEVLKPMGMLNSTYQQPPSANHKKFLATGYRDNGKEVKTKFHIYPEEAAAGLWSNPTDLATYIIETQEVLRGKPGKVLDKEMTLLRLTPYVDSNAALGVFIEKKGNDKYFRHSGADEGFLSTYTGSLENGNGVVVMVNCDNGRILNEVVNSVALVYGWKDYYQPIMKTAIAISESLMAEYEGTYLLEEDTINIVKSGESLLLKVNNAETYKIYFSSPLEFFMKDLPFNLRFEKDAAGIVRAFYMKQGNNELQAKKLMK